MSKEVIESALATIGHKNLKGRWATPQKFMDTFIRLQDISINSWTEQSEKDYGEVIPISGEITEKELIEAGVNMVIYANH